jgi:hypothetical protein
MLGLILLLCAVWALVDHLRLASLTSAALLAGAFLVGLAWVMVVGYRVIRDADTPPEVREARSSGLAATGEVLDVEMTGWRKRRRMGRSFTIGPTRWLYSIRLRVRRPDLAEYEAEAVEYLTGDEVPERGMVVPLRVHPQHRDVVVFDLPPARA